MKLNFLKSLINHNVVKPGVELDAFIKVKILGSELHTIENRHFMITKINMDDDKVIFDTVSSYDGQKTRINHESVTLIDGMDPYRYASVFDIDENGNKVEPAKKRGPKTE